MLGGLYMSPQRGAMIYNLGIVDFASIRYSDLTGYHYSTTPIDGNAGSTNQLVPGDVFAVATNGGHYAKVRIQSDAPNYLLIQWVTYN